MEKSPHNEAHDNEETTLWNYCRELGIQMECCTKKQKQHYQNMSYWLKKNACKKIFKSSLKTVSIKMHQHPFSWEPWHQTLLIATMLRDNGFYPWFCITLFINIYQQNKKWQRKNPSNNHESGCKNPILISLQTYLLHLLLVNIRIQYVKVNSTEGVYNTMYMLFMLSNVFSILSI